MKFPVYVLWMLAALVQLPLLLSQWFTPDLQLKQFVWLPPAPIMPQSDPIPQLEATTNADASLMLQNTDRPLFSPTRRPPPPPKAPPPPTPPDLLASANVLGLYGQGAGAGVLVESEGRVYRVKPGAEFSGWTLKRISSQSAEFERGAETRELHVSRKRATASLAQTPQEGSAAAAPSFEAAAQTKKDLDAVRNSVRQMNARRAATGLPPLPEP
ncbi:MAG TPA: hypothetical protein PK347_01560 [Burkholderiaceae bacterium]|nr:hypothetical protein [Burkholderiaceae bacterium]